MSPIQPLTPLSTAAVQALAPKVSRSLSISSALSAESTSSAYSRSADDMIDRLAAQAVSAASPLALFSSSILTRPDVQTNATFFLWSAGNVRINGLDLTLLPSDAVGLVAHLQSDERFEIVHMVQLGDEEGDDWKVGS